MVAGVITGSGNLSAVSSTSTPNSAIGNSMGSWGRIRIEAFDIQYSGSHSPSANLATPGILFPPPATTPSVRVVAVDGIPVPDNPLGSYTPADQVGESEVGVRVEDGGGLFDTQNFTVSVVTGNGAPVITSTPVTAATEDVTYSYDVEAEDPDAGDVLTFLLESAVSGMTIDAATGLITWTPSNDQVRDNAVTVRVEDAEGLFDTQAFTVAVTNVNDTPEITSMPVVVGTEDAIYKTCLRTYTPAFERSNWISSSTN